MYKKLLALTLVIIACDAGRRYSQLEEYRPTYVPPAEEEPTPQTCQQTNDCPFSMFCDLSSNLCVNCLTDNHCHPGYTCIYGICQEGTTPEPDPVDPVDPPPVDPPSAVDPPAETNECMLGTCTQWDIYTLCLEEEDVPAAAPYCDYWTAEGCPAELDPYYVLYPDGWEDCVCLQECLVVQ